MFSTKICRKRSDSKVSTNVFIRFSFFSNFLVWTFTNLISPTYPLARSQVGSHWCPSGIPWEPSLRSHGTPHGTTEPHFIIILYQFYFILHPNITFSLFMIISKHFLPPASLDWFDRISETSRIPPVWRAETLCFGQAPNQWSFSSSEWSFRDTFGRRQARGRFDRLSDTPGTTQMAFKPL